MILYRLLFFLHFIRLCCARPQAIFDHYQPSLEEKKWIDNVEVWQKDVCLHLSNDTITGFVSEIARTNKLSQEEIINYIKNPPASSTYLSHFHYNIMDNGQVISKIAVPVESVIGLARDPRKCWDVTSETYTQSKEYLIPMHGAIFEFMTGFSRLDEPRSYLFDAGATFYSDEERQGTKWIIDWYGHQGVSISNVVAWEKKLQPPELVLKGVPDSLIPGFQYFNHAVDAEASSIWNPLTMIKKKCKKDDFVVFKLDIDHKPTETQIVKQLLGDGSLQALIDEFYYEEHFKNKAMHIHGWSNYKTSLADYYKLVIPVREKGFRMHYWP